MEYSPCEAIKNNVFGTMNVASEANRSGVKRMVLISTDKAVRPTINVPRQNMSLSDLEMY